MKRASCLIAIFIAAVSFAQQQPAAVSLENANTTPHVINGKVEQQSGAAFTAAVQQIARSGAGPLWIGYSVPSAGTRPHFMCCFDHESWNGSGCCSGCRLEGTNGNYFNSDGGTCVSNTPPTHIFIYMRYAGGQLTRVKTLTPDCAVDAAGTSLHWLNDVRAADSTAFLLPIALDANNPRDMQHQAIAAIALTGDPSADAALNRLLNTDQPEKTRENAAFWMAAERGKPGLQPLLKLAREDKDDRFREHLTFVMTVSKEPAAQTELIHMAHDDPAGRVRGQALFWMAQRAGAKVASEISNALENDPDTDVKKKAVFALSQMPNGEGVPKLIDVARRNANPAVRKQAMFWLGQSHDPRALSFIEEVLTR